MTVCILIPTPLEYDALASVLTLVPQPGGPPRTAVMDGQDVLVVESGLGQRQSRSTLATVVGRYTPESVLLAGTAGALDDRLRLGDLIVCDRIASTDGSTINTDQKLTALALSQTRNETSGPEAGSIRRGSAVTVDRPVLTTDERQRLREAGYDCVEMEAFAVAKLAAAHNIPFSMIRAISDRPGEGSWADGVTLAMTTVGSLLAGLFNRSI